MTRLLVVAPLFHGYGRAIAASFERIGYDVCLHHYDAVASPALKVWNKLRYELPSHLQGDDRHQSRWRATRLAIKAVHEAQPDVVLVVRGDTLDQRFWEAAASGRRVAAWLYDEVRRMPHLDLSIVGSYARLATYSAQDARALSTAGIDALYVPTGFDDARSPSRPSAPMSLINFIGAPLPGRIAALTALADAGVPVCAWGRGWSDHPVDKMRTWRLRSRHVPNRRDVPGDRALAIMRDSSATLNVHGDQDGFTMRTFESCGVGGVQLIDRPDVSEFYDPGSEVLVFRNHAELIEQGWHAIHRPGDFAGLRRRARRRTLAEHTFVHRARVLETLWT